MEKQIRIRLYLIGFFVMFLTVIHGQNVDSLKLKSLFIKSCNYFNEGRYEKSRDIAEQVLEKDSCYCYAYILLGHIYATIANEKSIYDEYVENSVIYCLSIEMFEKAKGISTECLSQADEWINIYSNYLIGDEIFISVREGDEVEVGGWINRKTKFRFRD